MAKTLMIGLTGSGLSRKVNEDTFSCQGRIYPDMISGHEEKSIGSSDYNQLYIVTEGFGGPAIGDLSGRVAQALALEMSEHLDFYRGDLFDFVRFSRDFLIEADQRIKVQIRNKTDQAGGISLCMLLIDGNDAYILNLGNTASFLFRDEELLRLTKPNMLADGNPSIWLGQGCPLALSDYEPNTRRLVLTPGDIILMTTRSVYSAYAAADLRQSFLSPDAFVGTIRGIHEESLSFNETENHTTVAVKIQSLEHSEPAPIPMENSEYQYIMQNPYQRPSEKYNKQNKAIAHNIYDQIPEDNWYNNDYRSASRAATAAQEYSRMKQTNNEFDFLQENGDMDSRHATDADNNRENPFATFFRFLLLGFLIGLVILLIIWFFVLS